MGDHGWGSELINYVEILQKNVEKKTPIVDEKSKAPFPSLAEINLRAARKNVVHTAIPKTYGFTSAKVSSSAKFSAFATRVGKLIELVPVSVTGDPLTVDDFVLWPDPQSNTVYFSLAKPRLSDFTLAIKREVIDGTIETTGASAVIAVSAHPLDPLLKIEKEKESWLRCLKQSGYSQECWKFQPLSFGTVEGRLNLPQNHYTKIQQSVGNDAGMVAFIVELSEVGAQLWDDMLEEGKAEQIQGIFELKATIFIRRDNQTQVKEANLQSPLGQILSSANANMIQRINPQISFYSHIIVEKSPNIENVSVDWRPSEGAEPQSIVFGPEGGHFSGTVTSQNIDLVYIDWHARVNYGPLGWPVIKETGRLSVAGNNWSVIVDPASWITYVSIVVVLFDENGNVLLPSDEDVGDKVHCELSFKARYLEGSLPLLTDFDAPSQQMISIPFPLPPGQLPEEVKLTVFAFRSSKSVVTNNLKVRLLEATETVIVVKVASNSTIDIVTNKDPTSELSVENLFLGHLEKLSPNRLTSRIHS